MSKPDTIDVVLPAGTVVTMGVGAPVTLVFQTRVRTHPDNVPLLFEEARECSPGEADDTGACGLKSESVEPISEGGTAQFDQAPCRTTGQKGERLRYDWSSDRGAGADPEPATSGFQPGDVVRLASGSPPMTVVSVGPGNAVALASHDRGGFHSHEYPGPALVLENPSVNAPKAAPCG